MNSSFYKQIPIEIVTIDLLLNKVTNLRFNGQQSSHCYYLKGNKFSILPHSLNFFRYYFM